MAASRLAPPHYGYAHRKARTAYLARLVDGAPCARCGRGMYRTQALDLDHDDHDPTAYLGLAHAACNRGAGGRKARARERAVRTRTPRRGAGATPTPRHAPPPVTWTSRPW